MEIRVQGRKGKVGREKDFCTVSTLAGALFSPPTLLKAAGEASGVQGIVAPAGWNPAKPPTPCATPPVTHAWMCGYSGGVTTG